MTGLELLNFIKTNTGWVSPHTEEEQALKYFNETVDKGLYLTKFHNGKLIGVVTYYRVADLTQAIVFDNIADLPPNPLVGPYVYVSFIVVKEDYRKKGVVNELIEKLKHIKPLPKAGYWVSPEGEWKVIERGGDMKSNCGIVAFDQIAGYLSGRSNVISLSTLARIAQDNEFLLYPLKVKRADLLDIPKPYILHNDFHFQTIKSDNDLIAFNLPEEVYVLSSSMVGGIVVDDDEARTIRGAKKFFKQILAPVLFGPVSPFITGAKDPFGKALGSLVAGGTGFLTGGPVGAGLGMTAYNLQAGKNMNEKTPITFGSGLTAAGTGAAGGAATGILGAGASALGGSLGSGVLGSGLSTLGNVATSSAQGSLASGILGKLSSAFGGGSGNGATALSNVGGSGSAFGATGTGSGGFYTPLTSANLGLSGGGSAALPFASGAGSSLATGVGSGGGFLSKLGTQGTLGALSLGAGLLKSVTQKNPYEGLDGNISALEQQAQARLGGQSSSPLQNSVNTELMRGIATGQGAVKDLASDAFFQAAFRQKKQENEIRKQQYLNNQAMYGRVNSGESQAQLALMDQQLAQELDDFTAKYQEDSRKQAIDSLNQYLELASKGDAAAFEQLRGIIGDEYNAKLAVQSWLDGKNSGISNTLTNLGQGLILNKLMPTSGMIAPKVNIR